MSVPSHEYLIYTPGEGFFESMGWNGISYSKSVDAAFYFTSKQSHTIQYDLKECMLK